MLLTVSITGPDDVHDDGNVPHDVSLASAAGDTASSAASHPEDRDLAETDAASQPRTPEQPLQKLVELIRFLWCLLTRGVGV